MARFILPRPRKVLLAVLAVVLVVGGVSMDLTSRLTMGGYENPDTQAAHAEDTLEERFGQGRANLTLIVRDERGVDSPEVAEAGAKLAKDLADDGVKDVASYWTAGKAKPLRAENGRGALVTGRIPGDFDEVNDRVGELRDDYTGTVHGLDVTLGGTALMNHEQTERASEDAAKAESLVFPLVLVVLVLIFGSLVAALLPLAVALGTMLTVFGLMWGLTFVFDANNLLVNTCTFLGLGLAIDYSLLFLTRYREELARGVEQSEAIRVTMRTVGRTVTFSAVTLAIACLSLVVLPFGMFQSIGIGGAATTLTAGAATLVIVPAMLAWAGPRIDKLRLVRRKSRKSPAANDAPAPVGAPATSGYWHRLATLVMRRPVSMMTAVLAFAALLAVPALDLNTRLPDEQVLPTSAQSAQVARTLKADFDSRETEALLVVADEGANGADVAGYAQRLSALQDVSRVDAVTGSYADGRRVAPPGPGADRFSKGDGTYLSVIPAVEGSSDAGAAVVERVRAADSPFPVEVGGQPAVAVDTFDTVGERLPLTLGILAVGTYVLLFLLTGSALLPLAAMLLSVISLAATFGSLVFVFQDGHLKWLVGDFVTTGTLNWTVPVMIAVLAFGLSMDYAVFILSRIKEEYERTGAVRDSVALGLERVGKVITYAAVVLSLTFIVMLTSGISYMKALGLGVPLAIIMDATLIRGILLPAVMRLLGPACWWAPGPMRRLHDRFGIAESAAPAGRTEEAAPSKDPARV
ncbi:MMPL family transporter [Streptomyces sp. NPDC048172]|uniref:MMPL family transporter n=1 Tax=Streptomyces sp. NPDC048172 TaxID=3365505 RepID=UPI0037211741